MARVLIGNVKPVKGVDYLTEEDINELGGYFAPVGYVDGTYTVSAVGELDSLLTQIYSTMGKITQKVINVHLNVYDVLPGGNWFITLKKRSDDYGHVEASSYSINGAAPCVCRKSIYEGIWGDWAYENPPMEVNKEYLTTEQWMGKPVYTTLVDCGTLTGNPVDVLTTHTVHHIIRHCGYVGTYGLPMINITLDNEYSAWANVTDSNGYLKVNLFYGTGMVGNNGMVRVWYTKFQGGI